MFMHSHVQAIWDGWKARASFEFAQKEKDPEVVAAVQRALMDHPYFKGSEVHAFGLANTAIGAFTSAVSSTILKSEDGK